MFSKKILNKKPESEKQKKTATEIDAKKVLADIQSGDQVLIKLINSPAGDDQHWEFLIKQLLHPRTERRFKQYKDYHDPSMIWNSYSKEWEYRDPSRKRGQPKDTTYIKKTSMTLPTKNGQMKYFIGKPGQSFYPIALGFRIGSQQLGYIPGDTDQYESITAEMKVKKKHIHPHNINSDSLPGVWNTKLAKEHKLPPAQIKLNSLESISLEKLKEKNEEALKKNEIPQWNEILASPSVDAVYFLFTPSDDLISRLNLLHKRTLIAKELSRHLPLFIMGPKVTVKEYTLEMQLDDLYQSLINISERRSDTHYRVQTEFFTRIDLFQVISDFNKEENPNDQLKEKLVLFLGRLLRVRIEQKHLDKLEELLTLFLNIKHPILNNETLNELLLFFARDIKNLTMLPKLTKEFILTLIKVGADINYQNDLTNESVIEFLVKNCSIEIFSEILQVSRKTLNKSTIETGIFYATDKKKEDIIGYLKKFNEIPIIKKMEVVVDENNFILMDKEQLNIERFYWTKNKYYALHMAVLNREDEVVTMLCKMGANPVAIPKKYKDVKKDLVTPLQLAINNKNHTAVKIMTNIAGDKISAEQWGQCILESLKSSQFELAKQLLSSSHNVSIDFYGKMEETIVSSSNELTVKQGKPLAEILKGVANDNELKIPGKRILLLHFINQQLCAAMDQNKIMTLVLTLMSYKNDQKAKDFLFDASPDDNTYRWSGKPTCAFWAKLMELIKVRLLEISMGAELNKQAQEFLSTHTKPQSGVLASFVKKTKSTQIAEIEDVKEKELQIANKKTKLVNQLEKEYGLHDFAKKSVSAESKEEKRTIFAFMRKKK